MISVVVPVYRVESYLERCVKSLLNQTFSDFELILVDDGSPDRCPEICDDWARKDNRIRVIHKKNGGLPDARNAGIAAAAGEYLAFVDSDDWVEPEFLETLYKGIVAYGADVVQCNFRRIYVNGTQRLYSFPPADYDRDYIIQTLMPDMLSDRLTQISCSRCNKIYKTYLVKKAVELCDSTIRMGEDYLLNAAVLGFTSRICALDTPPLYNYCENGDSMCAKYRSEDKFEKIAYYQNIDHIAKNFQCGITPNAKVQMQQRWQDYIYECAISTWNRAEKKKEIREIISMLDRTLWRRNLELFATPAERVCQYMSYFGLVGPMLWLVDVVKKIKGIA